MNHMTVIEDYFCDICQSSQWSDCGNPFNRELDGTDTCNKCHRLYYNANCTKCSTLIILDRPKNKDEEHLCIQCFTNQYNADVDSEYWKNEADKKGFRAFIIVWVLAILGILVFYLALKFI